MISAAASSFFLARLAACFLDFLAGASFAVSRLTAAASGGGSGPRTRSSSIALNRTAWLFFRA